MSLMDWIPAAGALLGGLSSKDKTATATTDRAPWAPAQPWITQNIASGQNLQQQYAAQPFSQGQINAYGNSSALTDNFRNTANSLIPQIGAQRQFDRTNPLGRANQYDYGAGTTGTVGGANSLGFTSQFGMNPVQQQQAANTFKSYNGLTPGDTGSDHGGGGFGSTADASAGYGTTPGGNPGANISGPGIGFGFDPSGAARGLLGGPLGALFGGLTMQQLAPVMDLIAPGMNGYNMGDYGRSATEMGAPNASQAAAIAADFAQAMADAGYGGNDGGGLGDSGLGSAGNAGNDGAGGIGSW